MNKAIKFVREVRIELDKVVWPSRKQNIRYTAVVIAVSLVVGIYLSILDRFFGSLISNYILR